MKDTEIVVDCEMVKLFCFETLTNAVYTALRSSHFPLKIFLNSFLLPVKSFIWVKEVWRTQVFSENENLKIALHFQQ